MSDNDHECWCCDWLDMVSRLNALYALTAISAWWVARYRDSN